MDAQYRWYKCVHSVSNNWTCVPLKEPSAANESGVVTISISKRVPYIMDKAYITSQLYPLVKLDHPVKEGS